MDKYALKFWEYFYNVLGIMIMLRENANYITAFRGSIVCLLS